MSMIKLFPKFIEKKEKIAIRGRESKTAGDVPNLCSVEWLGWDVHMPQIDTFL